MDQVVIFIGSVLTFLQRIVYIADLSLIIDVSGSRDSQMMTTSRWCRRLRAAGRAASAGIVRRCDEEDEGGRGS